MKRAELSPYFGFILVLGALWGLAEAGLGMWLRACASSYSGALMCGFALFFIASAWEVSGKISAVFVIVILASLFKLMDAALLSLPLKHGAIANPIFAFFLEALAFLFLIGVVQKNLREKAIGHSLLGGMSALLAANLFPLVKYATGVPACVVPGTGYPLSLYYLHLSVAVSFLTVPAGFWVGARLREIEFKFAGKPLANKISPLASSAFLILCAGAVVIIRLV